ncbi:MAG: uracil phosphoribosyltransferase [Clostridiales bacterium]|nr:uracil phosphoribosyltransferase [Clostridiales bacterium]
MGKLIIVDHPLIQSKIRRLRDKETSNKEFRELVSELSSLIVYEATRDLPLKDIEVETPHEKTTGKVLDCRVAFVPILRTGINMADGALGLIPTAKAGHIGIYRDPDTLMPVEYYCKLPKVSENLHVFILDPCIATGGTDTQAINFLKERDIKNITLITLIAAPEAVKKIQSEHTDVDIYTAALDRFVNDEGYVIPGLGDVGYRLFGTK